MPRISPEQIGVIVPLLLCDKMRPEIRVESDDIVVVDYGAAHYYRISSEGEWWEYHFDLQVRSSEITM